MTDAIRIETGLDDGLYDARVIANFILDRFDARRFEITNLKLNKILYFIHGNFLGKFGIPLIRNHFEPWDYGPVARVIYDEFKEFGSRPIESRAHSVDPFTREKFVISYACIAAQHWPFLEFLTSRYVGMPSSRLVELTHRPGSPWSQARARVFAGRFTVANRLRNDEIAQYFSLQFGA